MGPLFRLLLPGCIQTCDNRGGVSASVDSRGVPVQYGRQGMRRLGVNPFVEKLVKEVLFHSPLRRYFFPRYLYNFTAPQLCFLCQCIESTWEVEGAVAEIGCASGSTTVFLNKYMDAQHIRKDYYALDTFCGFVAEDIQVEVADRGKSPGLFTGFQVNKKKWFDATVRQNGIGRVRSIEADVNRFDLTTLGPLAFVLLDVDLYRPIKKALPELYQVLSPGGMMVVDDCNPQSARWDGADQAYKEFLAEQGWMAHVVHGKLGIVRKGI